jgi:transposase InsO family protein
MRPISVTKPHHHYQLDLAKFKETTAGNLYVMVLIDIFSKYVFARAAPTKEALPIVDFVKDVVEEEGKFAILQSDNGTEFNNQYLEAYLEKAGIGNLLKVKLFFIIKINYTLIQSINFFLHIIQTEHRNSSVRHPQSNGNVERFNGTLRPIISKVKNVFKKYI